MWTESRELKFKKNWKCENCKIKLGIIWELQLELELQLFSEAELK